MAQVEHPRGEIILLRHGETEWSAAGKHTGRTDVALTERGEQQAKAAGTQLTHRTIAHVFTSPLSRAHRTAELAGFADATVDPDLQEWDYGGYEGLTTKVIRATKPGWLLWRDGVTPHPDGEPAESIADVASRADRVISDVEPLLKDGDVVLVSHGHFLRVFAARWLRQDAHVGALLALDTASLSWLGYEHEERVIRHWNLSTDTTSA